MVKVTTPTILVRGQPEWIKCIKSSLMNTQGSAAIIYHGEKSRWTMSVALQAFCASVIHILPSSRQVALVEAGSEPGSKGQILNFTTEC